MNELTEPAGIAALAAGALALVALLFAIVLAVKLRMGANETRLDGAISHRALVRYDAYQELSGHQSTSLALLDAAGNGVVISCLAGRDAARLSCTQVHDGRGEFELSPEEDEAIRLALAEGATRTVTLD